jgi:hypothetical protein
MTSTYHPHLGIAACGNCDCAPSDHCAGCDACQLVAFPVRLDSGEYLCPSCSEATS